jgi:capsid assembly protein
VETIIVPATGAPAPKPGDQTGIEVKVNADGTKATVTRDQEAAAKAAADKAAADAALAARPKNLPEKFKSVDDMIAAYAELEAKQSGGKPKEEPKVAPPTQTLANIDTDALAREYSEQGGKLTDATLATLKEKGITPEMVTGYIDGVKAQVAADRAELVKAMNGSESDLTLLYDWASKNLSPDELRGYNALVTGKGRNIPAAKLVLDSMVARYNEALGKDPHTPVVGVNSPGRTGGAEPYGDRAQMVAAMSDPRYKTSPAYRAEVESRVKVTNF